MPNLTRLEVAYGVNKIGMNYERMLFGMKIADATALAKAFSRSSTLTTVILTGNLIDDDLLRMLMSGLIKNHTITSLDLSHNKITNHGTRLLSKLLGENSVLTTLDLADNHIHADGGRYIARGLRENDSLLHLNLRLNQLQDEGCQMLLESLQENRCLVDLHIGSNHAGHMAMQTLCTILRSPQCNLQVINISGNNLSSEHFDLLHISLLNNKTVRCLDMRSNPGYDRHAKVTDDIETIVHRNEFNGRKPPDFADE
jgi:Ran GTPase-activating protein (RanGAP) involved in mRNA processing and transport